VTGPAAWAIFALLFVSAIAIASAAARFAKVPYTVVLVVAGFGIGLLHLSAAPTLTPGLVMYVFLPPLLFAAAWEMDLTLLRRWWLPVALLATIGVGIGVAITYAVVRFGAHIDGTVAVAFGALVAATDPIAVIALFRELRIDRGLSTIVEGESLFNDGVAVVLVRSLVLGAASGAVGTSLSFDLAHAAFDFVVLTAGGIASGIVIGVFAVWLLRRTRAPGLEIAITVMAAFGAYAAGEAIHASGIVAVILTGLTCSVARSGAQENAVATIGVDRFWEAAALVANSVLFVLVGLAIGVGSLEIAGAASLWGIGAVLVSRAVSVFGIMRVSARAGSPVPASWNYIVALGGLRGALAMALVLGLPENFHDRSVLVSMVYAVVLFTLVVQGLSLRPVMRSLGLSGGDRRVAESSG
jgi:monovalent cation:H+ antiporter, CPA1 family